MSTVECEVGTNLYDQWHVTVYEDGRQVDNVWVDSEDEAWALADELEGVISEDDGCRCEAERVAMQQAYDELLAEGDPMDVDYVTALGMQQAWTRLHVRAVVWQAGLFHTKNCENKDEDAA